MSGHKQLLGIKGERLALRFLRKKGYRIIRRNFSCRFGEIDIIARQRKTTVFIEVKTRASINFGLPEDSIKKGKIKRLWRVAQFYIQNNAHADGEFRFDVVSIIIKNSPQIQLIRNAF